MYSPYYVNLNGAYGKDPYAKTDYQTLPELLAEMDRLGIQQVVTYHTAGRDLHPMFGNRYLMADIAATSGAAERVIPAFVIAPPMLAGKGEMEHLEEAFASGQVRCVVLCPKTSRYRFLEIQRVLARIQQYDPVVLVDLPELGDSKPEYCQQLDELERTAEKFPGMKFIVRKVSWGRFSTMVDVLARTNNVYMDTSLLHTNDALKIVADQVGSQRLVFSLGTHAQAGAAIAGLAYADLSQQDKDQIAWDNFVALFSDSDYRALLKSNRKTLTPKVSNRFWAPFIRGEGVKDTLVIDMHTHIGPFTRSWTLTDNEFDGQIRQLEGDMEMLGIDVLCSQSESALFGEPISGNWEMLHAIGEKKGRFLGNLVVSPVYYEQYTQEVLDAFYANGYFRGMKLMPGYLGIKISDPRLEDIFRYADAHRLYILVHSWETDGCGTPQQIADTALLYPNATFVIAHAGGGDVGREQCERIAADPKYANCYFEFSGSFSAKDSWTESLKKIDYHRVLFGTDTIAHDMAWELGRLLSLGIPDEQLQAILGENMQRILNNAQL